MLDITFRTDELSAREMHLAYALGTSGDPLIQIEFILLRAMPHALAVDELTRQLWQQPASHVNALTSTALLAATEATKAAMERAIAATTSKAESPLPDRVESDVDGIFDEAAESGLEM